MLIVCLLIEVLLLAMVLCRSGMIRLLMMFIMFSLKRCADPSDIAVSCAVLVGLAVAVVLQL